MTVNINLSNLASNNKSNKTTFFYRKTFKEIKEKESDKLTGKPSFEINTLRQAKEKFTWDIQELEKIENQLRNKKFPNKEIQLTPGVVIVDIEKFISSHLETCKNFPGERLSLPCFLRLKTFVNII
jgi:predicted transcriptional regulator